MKINKLYIGLFVFFMVLIFITYISRYTEGMFILPNKSNLTPEDCNAFQKYSNISADSIEFCDNFIGLKYQKEDIENYMKVGIWSLSWTPEGFNS